MWPALSKITDFSGLVVLCYALWWLTRRLLARVFRHTDSSAKELETHRSSASKVVADERLRLLQESAGLRAELDRVHLSHAREVSGLHENIANLHMRYGQEIAALQDRRIAEIREMATGSGDQALELCERALGALLHSQEEQRHRDAVLASRLEVALRTNLPRGPRVTLSQLPADVGDASDADENHPSTTRTHQR